MPRPFHIPGVLACCLVLHLASAEEAPEVSATVGGQTWSLNGQSTIPTGLFGVHAVGLSPELVADLGIECLRTIEFVPGGGTRLTAKDGSIPDAHQALSVFIDCQGDRFYEPLVLRNPSGFAEQCATIGRQYGERWKALAERTHLRGIVQWWNEPYLNWAERSAGERGSTIQQQWYDLEQAVDGGPVTVKGMDRPLSHFVWRRTWPVRYVEKTDRKSGKTRREMIVGWSVAIPEGLQVGDTFTAAEKRYWREPGVEKEWTVEEHFFPVDPSAAGYWSGRQNLEFYLMMFGPWATALREANPAVTILAGWDFNYQAGDWAVWSELYRPLLQAFPQLIDGLTEHHYGLPPERIQAWYETGTADAMAITGRFLKNWNTECQGRLDPAVYGNSSNAVGASGAEAALWEANYNLADIIGLCARLPDKAASRTIHNFAGGGFAQCGGAWALRLLEPLRGQLLAVDCTEQGVWISAARNGSDTVVACYNHRPQAVTLALSAPGSSAVLRRLVVDGEQLRIDEQAVQAAAGGWSVALPSREAAVLVIADAPAPGAGRVEEQVFLREGALLRAGEDGGIAGSFVLEAAQIVDLAGVRLRLVTDHLDGPVTVTLGTHRMAFRRDLPVTDVEVPVEVLQVGELPLRFTGAEGGLLCGASLVLRKVGGNHSDH